MAAVEATAPGPAAAPPARSRAPRRRRLTPSGRRERNAALRFISPWIVGFLVFTAWPILYSAYLSLTDYDVINDPTFVGLENYREMAQDPKVALSLWNTLVYTVLQVPLYTVLALGLSILLNQAGRSAGFFRTAFFIPKMTPPVAVGVLLLLLFNGQYGVVNEVLSWFGIQGPSWTTDQDWIKPGLVLISLWTVGSAVIILLAALRNVPQDLYDAARVDGAGFWRRTGTVTVPMISGAIFFVVVVNTIAGFQMFTEAYAAYFGAGNSTYRNDAALFYVIYLFQEGFQELHMGYASALAWLLFVVIMLVTLVQLLVSRRLVYYEGEQR
ncbi:carbohydrate ABC transporter permease [Cellulosimicrobium cellulans]|uniref:carbohydrate ABC transporter permease n=1 Tax=Cellulosimicrobium cellulans TaxID=1710 RepID=UPI0009F47404|nr:sugar ABC transporter permease [Cellulosimicrobium cellulans]